MKLVPVIRLFLSLLCLGALARAQYPDDPPPRHVLDEAFLYAVDKDRMEELENYLLDLKREHGIKIYVVVAGRIGNGESLKSQAQRVYQQWIGDDPSQAGVIIMCDVDSQYLELGEYQNCEDNPLENDIKPRLTQAELMSAYSDAGQAVVGESNKIDFIEKFTRELGAGIAANIPPAGVPPVEPYLWKHWAYLAAAVVALGLLSLLFARRAIKTSQEHKKTFYFPEAHSPTRLGAPFGAAASNSIRF